MNFDNGDLTSTSSYGKATGTPKFVTVDNKKCIQFDGTSGTVAALTRRKRQFAFDRSEKYHNFI